MKSIKPGRGPSMMGAIGSAAAAIFGVIWTISAMSMGAPIVFALFGVVFVLMGIGQAVYNYKNATGKDRFSVYDITDEREESDPLNEYFSKTDDEDKSRSAEKDSSDSSDSGDSAFCPYCGAEAEGDYTYCAKCGKKLPQ